VLAVPNHAKSFMDSLKRKILYIDSEYRKITNIGDELFEVEEYIIGEHAPDSIFYYSLDHIIRITKL